MSPRFRFAFPSLFFAASLALRQPAWGLGAVLWLAFEHLSIRRSERRARRGGLVSLASLLELYSRSDAASETLLEHKVLMLQADRELDEYEQRWLERLRELMRLRAMAFGKKARGKQRLRQAFALAAENPLPLKTEGEPLAIGGTLSIQDLIESSILVSDLHWKLYRTCIGEFPELGGIARQLFEGLFGFAFEKEQAKRHIAFLTDRMQNEQGVVYAIIGLLRNGEIEEARSLAQSLLTEQVDIDEDTRTALYWMSELLWFTGEDRPSIGDHESTIRYLYHLCFSGPDRAGFLEVDSQFLAEFETISELAREGFSFRENLFEKTLDLWRQYEGIYGFDSVFQSVLEVLAGANGKLYEKRDAWEKFWNREKAQFSREYLYVVEGNLSYAAGEYADAVDCYHRALEVDSGLRPALLNLVFSYAKLGDRTRHAQAADRVADDERLSPAGLYVAGNSYLLLGEEQYAEAYFERLRAIPGWERKTDYYKSTFCFENGFFEMALRFAQRAHELSPADSSVRYHLSLCHNALGNKDQALDLVRAMEARPQWLDFYRFTLERDAGHHHEASKTLLQIPSSYFQDPEELEAALEFARDRKDFVLMRHLRRSSDKAARSA